VAVTFINDYDPANVFLLFANPPDFIVVPLLPKKLNPVLKALYLLGLRRLVVLKLLQPLLSQSAFPLQLSAKVAQFVQGVHLSEVQSESTIIVIDLLRNELGSDDVLHDLFGILVI
jgi:hypothetical protein